MEKIFWWSLHHIWAYYILITGIQAQSGRRSSSSDNGAASDSYYSPSLGDPYFFTDSVSANDVKLNDSMPWFNEPLWGLTYVPYRRKASCSSVSEKDVMDDLRNISRLAKQIYVPEMYCQFAPLIIRTTSASGNRLVLGLSLRSKEVYEQQYAKLERAFKSSTNISHVNAISVGYNDLQRYLDLGDTNFVVSALKRVKKLVTNSANPRINVTTNDAYRLLFDQSWTPYLDAYIGLISVDADRSPVLAFTRVVDNFNNIKSTSRQIDDKEKRAYTAGAGWPSAGKGFPLKFEQDVGLSKKGANASELIVGNASDQADFIARLICAAHRQGGIRYFYHYAFDPLWLYPNTSDQKANWGLIDADRRALKPALVQALNPNCAPSDLESSEEDEEQARTEKRKVYRARAIGLGIGVLLVFVLMIVLIVIFWRRKREADKQRRALATRNISTADSNDTGSTSPIYRKTREEYIGMADAALYTDLKNMVDPKYIINVDDLDFKETIGEGHFGIVQKAVMSKDGHQIDVAVKRLHDGATHVRQFISEGIRMENLHHPNVLHLTGICFVNQLPMIVLPFMEKDNLLTFVKDPKNELTVRRILDFCSHIAEGMQYLHSLKLVHRDLAARNCMLDSSLTVKVSDFGLCRDISETDSYQATRTFELPVRWMAPETILKLEWTNKSDVWSYGVVLWELLSRGKQPYKDILLVELRMYLENGGRLPKPRSCPDIVYDYMKTCWHRSPEERPEFSVLRHTLSHLIQAVDDGRVGDVAAYYNVVSIIENDSLGTDPSSRS